MLKGCPQPQTTQQVTQASPIS